MNSVSGSTVAIAVGAFVASYCLYWDYRRRSSPSYPSQLREKRLRQKVEKRKAEKAAAKAKADMQQSVGNVPAEASSMNEQELRAYYMQQMAKAEEKLSTNEFSAAARHIANAVRVCGDAQALLQVLQEHLPANVFQMLIQELTQQM